MTNHSPYFDQIIRLQQEEEAALLRAERALRMVGHRGPSVCVCDHLVIEQPLTDSQHEVSP